MTKEQPFHWPVTFDEALSGIVKLADQPPLDEVQVWEGDSRKLLQDRKLLPNGSVHLVLTDPPYFLDGLDNEWKKGINGSSPRATGSVGKLPVGMKFDPKQGRDLQRFMEPVAKDLWRVLVPGGFFVCFSQPRLVHRMAVAIEDAGFEIRDLLAWHYTQKAQFKAFSLDHFIDKLDMSDAKKRQLKRELANRKTPQLRPQFEAMILAQKPRSGTFLDNWQDYKTGLIDASKSLGNGVPTTVMQCEKEPMKYDEHLTVKPVKLLRHLIELLTIPGQTVLDPFLGSGSTCVAAAQTGRACIGIEINPDYVTIARKRLRREVGEHESQGTGKARTVSP